jgi:hypothetical protein
MSAFDRRVALRAARAAFYVALLAGPMAPHLAAAQGPAVYPANGQSEAQQDRDDAACYKWARNATGVDPVAARQPAPQETEPAVGGGERVRGAARGALGGVAIGAIAGDAGAGAGIGAVAGTMVGGRRARDNQAARNAQARDRQQQQLDTYYRAYAACMEGRGYTVR